ncbi:3-oxoacyl-(acyl-carrier-protein) reductase [uncultured Alphaproteobacteria bacterium]|uniref:3-oxoacyl-[acyl-carrier-protein] reductase n=1 Tax=uncultured Alphaproteobacteria bacterium TaxID=91750 RepID=A0A212KLG0_9PROT|nr:3-oxoacyl-(acyl-carrier-protein) reductase [uncultured Alphaproteobacteria bacterium]
MFDLTDKCALVTGASGGIGSAIAKALAARGATVVLSGTRKDALDAVAAEIGDKAIVIAANLSDPAETDRLIADAEKAMGRIDILVNNAGLTRDGLAMRMKDEDWQTVLDVNLTAAFRLTRAAMRGMMKRRFGRVIGISSVVGVTGNPGQANYAASKAGLIGMTKALAQELAARNITVNCVAPGMIATPMTDVLTEDQRQRMFASIPAGRFGTSEDVAAAVVYLAADEAAYVTGQTLHVNGGMAMI